jgi:hypothetical protein
VEEFRIFRNGEAVSVCVDFSDGPRKEVML